MLNIKLWIATLAVWMGVSFTFCVLGGVLALFGRSSGKSPAPIREALNWIRSCS